mmetsp:Transcript_3493/g.4201  ORF Transcript_3493/g.4201 Transcript_3493/m.4201 type:complete len:131 (+) Transcript_3493:198-590(+)
MANQKSEVESPELMEDAETSNAPFADPIGAITDQNKDDFESVAFPEKHYKDLACCIPKYLCCHTIDIHAMPNEAEITMDSCLCCHNEKRVPYGELQGVGETTCCCFTGVDAGALSPTDKGQRLRIIPGCG